MDDDILFPDSRPTRSDAVRNREVLLETAARLFDHNGVDNVTMSAVAQEAGVGKGTLYRHFNSKTELCHALLDQDQRNLQQRTLTYLAENRYDPIESLCWFMIEVANFVNRNLDKLYVIGDTGAPPTLEQHVHQWWRLTIRGLLARARVEGDIDYITDALFVLLDVNTIHFQRSVRGYAMDRIEAGITDVVHRLTDDA